MLFPKGNGQLQPDLKVRDGYKQLLMAPYSATIDAHLWVSLSYPPDASKDFVKATVGYYNERQKEVSFNLEFDRYYMEENKAGEAETLYVEANRQNKKEAYALVYILEGKAVLDNVIIDGKSIKDWVE